MTQPHHYTECGLDDVYLVNGFAVHETPYGRGVAVTDADALHEAIARAIVASTRPLRGQELRFLRAMLGLSQAALGARLGTSRATVARWEGRPREPLPGTADRALRLYYAISTGDRALPRALAKRLATIGTVPGAPLPRFEETAAGWTARAAA